MAGSGSEKRKRQITLKARVTEQEATLVRERADAAGVTIAGLIRYAVLDQTPLRASRKPPVDRALAARLIASLGPLACAFREAADSGDQKHLSETLEAAQRDLAELRVMLFEAMGRSP